MDSNALTLDVGCGLRPKGNVNIDIDKDRYWSEWKKLKVPNLIIADIKYAPFRPLIFDRVFFVGSFYQVCDESKTLTEIHRILKKNGILSNIALQTVSFHLYECFRRCRAHLEEGKWYYPFYAFTLEIYKLFVYLFHNNIPIEFLRRTFPNSRHTYVTIQTVNRIRKIYKRSGLDIKKIKSYQKDYLMPRYFDVIAEKQ